MTGFNGQNRIRRYAIGAVQHFATGGDGFARQVHLFCLTACLSTENADRDSVESAIGLIVYIHANCDDLTFTAQGQRKTSDI